MSLKRHLHVDSIQTWLQKNYFQHFHLIFHLLQFFEPEMSGEHAFCIGQGIGIDVGAAIVV